MKKIILFATALMVAGCGFLQNSTSSTGSNVQSSNVQSTTTTTSSNSNAAMSAGQGAGGNISALYKQFKADGNKFDYKNMQNILNTVSLVANCEGLKDNYKDTNYLTQFGKGLIAGSLGLVTNNNVNNVTGSLVDLVSGVQAVTGSTTQSTTSSALGGVSSALGNVSSVAQYASSINSLLSLFGGQ